MSESKEDYIKAIKEGDSTVLRRLYQEFLPRIRYLITTNGGREADAQDIFQNAILIIYEKAKNPDFELSSGFYTLLHGICRNLWGNRLQKKSFHEVTIPEQLKYSSDEDVQAEIEQSEAQNVFWESFQQLGEDCQKLLRLFFDKEKMEKITQLMGFGSVGYTKKRKFQCKEKLVNLVKEDPRYEELKI